MDSSVTSKKLQVILHRSLVESRNLALRKDCQQIHDLADAVEIIPETLTECDPNRLQRSRASLEDYQSRYNGSAYDYLSILDMEDREFLNVFENW